MEKLTVFVVIAVSVFIYVQHDAGFKFEEAKTEARIEFVERQGRKAASGARFVLAGGPDAIFVSHDQKSVRLKVPSHQTASLVQHRAQVFRQACAGYRASHLDEHGISVLFQFYRESGAMEGSMKVSPGICASFAQPGS